VFALLYLFKFGFIAATFNFVPAVFAYAFAAAIDVADITVLVRAGVFERKNGTITALTLILV
jgi:hypothetical protein